MDGRTHGRTRELTDERTNKRASVSTDVLEQTNYTICIIFTKFLGVIIDEKLNWSEHVNSFKIKTCQRFWNY